MADQIGEITVVYGEAKAQGPDGERVLAVGSPVYAGDVVVTGSEAAVEINFKDGAVLAQGADSELVLDEYVYDEDKGLGRFAVDMLHGTFRSVTGKIVDINPEQFHIETPLSIIGIRGTTTAHSITPSGREMHAIIDFDGKPVTVTSRVNGDIRIMSEDSLRVESSDHGLGPVFPLSLDDFYHFEQLSPESLRHGAPWEGMELLDGGDIQLEGHQEDHDGGGEEAMMLGHSSALHITPISAPFVLSASDDLDDTGRAEGAVPHYVPAAPPAETETEVVAPPEEEPITSHDFSASAVAMTVHLDTSPATYAETSTPGDTTPLEEGVTDIVGSATAATTIVGNDADNHFTGGAANDNFQGEGGNDTFVGSGGNDQFYGGMDIDFVDYSDQSQGVDGALNGSITKLAGGSDSVYDVEGIYGTAYGDKLFGDYNDNIIYGNGGEDTLRGGLGVDSLYGGDGDDDFLLSSDPVTGDKIVGGSGFDEIVWNDGLNAGTYDLTHLSFEGIEGISVGAGGYDGGGVTLAKTDVTNPFWTSGTVNGSTAGAKEIVTVNIGDGGGNTFDVSKLTFTNWDMTFNEFHTNGSSGNDTITGFDGQDIINGGDGNDLLIGSACSDTLNGGDGDDVFRFHTDPGTGYAGAATAIDGGAGTGDRLQVTGDADFTTLTSFTNVEQIEITANHTAEFMSAQATGQEWRLFGDTGGAETLKITQASGDTTDLHSFEFDSSWTNGQDYITIATSTGAETVIGSSSSERFLGSAGSDKLTGNGGNDIFEYQSDSQWTDKINGFVSGQDSLHLESTSVGNHAVGALDASHFLATTDATYVVYGNTTGMTADTHFVLVSDATSSTLYYDADGSAGGAGQLVATFDAPGAVDHDDITIFHT